MTAAPAGDLRERTGSWNRKLVDAAARAAQNAVRWNPESLDLRSLALPLYDADLELPVCPGRAPPARRAARSRWRAALGARGTTASDAAAAQQLRLALAPAARGDAQAAWPRAATNRSACSAPRRGPMGALRSLNFTRQYLGMTIAVLPVPQQFALSKTGGAFDEAARAEGWQAAGGAGSGGGLADARGDGAEVRPAGVRSRAAGPCYSRKSWRRHSRCWACCPGPTGRQWPCFLPRLDRLCGIRQAAAPTTFAAGHHQPSAATGCRGRPPRRCAWSTASSSRACQQPSFFASTTIPIIGGLRSVGAPPRANRTGARDSLRGAASVLVFDLKNRAAAGHLRLRLLPLHLVAAPVHLRRAAGRRAAPSATTCWRWVMRPRQIRGLRQRAGRVVELAAETFNDGLRAYYFAFAAIGWFFSPLALAVATVGVVFILCRPPRCLSRCDRERAGHRRSIEGLLRSRPAGAALPCAARTGSRRRTRYAFGRCIQQRQPH